jgi:predicted O-methyltransferase YrrM
MSRMAGIQVTPELEAYVESLLPEREPVLRRLDEEVATSRVPGIGPTVGQLLALLLRTAGSRDAIELGTASGYSAIWLARGCTGEVVTTERDPAMAERARRNLAEAGLAERVRVLEEDGVAYLEREERQVDAIFNDVLNYFPDEATVQRCFEASLRRLRPGGLLLADNALRRGEVLHPRSVGAHNIARWNALVAREPRLDSVIVPLRDGVSIARVR